MFNSKIISTGSYLPEKILTNLALEKIVETSNDWIVERTGILERRIAAEDELTSDLAYKASVKALENLDKNTIDMIVVATTTPDRTFPSVATILQHKLGLGEHCCAFDLQAVCSGFIYALTVADSFIKTGSVKRILVVGAEKITNLLDWTDRNTCILFGDGAGAVVLEATSENKGILAWSLHSDGQYFDLLNTSHGVGFGKTSGYIFMEGREVFKLAINKMSACVLKTLEKCGLTMEDVSLLIPHQANKRILSGVAKKLNFPEEKVIITLEKQGNTSAASIPLAIDFAYRNNRIKENDIFVLEALGGGLTWGSVVIRG